MYSNQAGVHADLVELIERHRRRAFTKPWQTPPDAHRVAAAAREYAGLLLDLGCGTGESAQALAAAHPEHFCLGVDRSWHRLTRHFPVSPMGSYRSGNVVLMHADSIDVLHWCTVENLMPSKIYLLYPNPWPKSQHLRRRWHGHGMFPRIANLGCAIELRCNWEIYAQEFALASRICGREARIEPVPGGHDLSRFEAKYRASGHGLYRVVLP